MKKISTLLVLFLLIFSCGKKEVKKENTEFKEPATEQTVPKVDEIENPENEADIPELIFTVQIAALRNQNNELLSIDGLKTYQENALTKYRLGNFETYQEAREFRIQILDKYKGAFIQALKNERPISIKEALQN